MRVLLDTHALFWWLVEPSRLSRRATSIMTDSENTILVSAAVAWELSIKAHLGKLDALPLLLQLAQHIEEEGFEPLHLSLEHGVRAGSLPAHHRDPFDRMLIAQAQALNLPILSADKVLEKYDITRIW